MSEKDWSWFGCAGHFICGQDCRFHMCTKVGNYLVSTVGELWQSRGVREIHAKYADPQWLKENIELKGDCFDSAYMKKFGFADVGCDRKYESMVFRAGKPCTLKDCNCGLPRIDGAELDFRGYNEAGDAMRGHMELCKKFDSKR